MSKIANRSIQVLTAAVLLLLLSISPTTASPKKNTHSHSSASSSIDYDLGSEIRISDVANPEPQRSNTAVAYNSNKDEYMVVWTNEWPGANNDDIYARRVKSDGTLLSWFSVAAGANGKYDPAVVYNSVAEEYLVVWLYSPSSGGNTNEVWGRMVSWNGATLQPEFKIASWPNRVFGNPCVAWNSNLDQYLVVWDAQNATTLEYLDISSMLLSANGDIVTGRNLTISNQPFDPDVVYNPIKNEYFVVYNTFDMTTQQDIKGVRVKADNSVINPPGEIDIVSNNVPELEPAVATNGKFNYTVVWQTWVASDYDIYGQRVDFNGNKPWNWNLFSGASGISETNPDIAYDVQQGAYLITWQRFDSPTYSIRAQSRDFTSSTYENFTVASNAINPVIAAGSSQFLIAYQGIYPSGGSAYNHIFAQFLSNMDKLFLPILMR